MPKFGQMTEESVIVEWRKKEGDKVAKGDILFTVETDKSVMDVESFEEGTLLKIVVQPGVSVPVQSTVGFLGKPGEAISTVTAPAPAASKPAAVEVGRTVPSAPSSPQPTVAQRTAETVVPAAAPVAFAPVPSGPALFRISPRAAALAGKYGINPSQITGTGPGGRVVEKDVKAHLEAKEKSGLPTIQGAGVADTPRAAAEKLEPMSKMRQIIAQRLTQSVTTAPHFFVTAEVDMTDLIKFRAQLKEKGAAYSVTDFISQAVVRTLKEFPDVNSSTDGKSIRRNSRVHLGLAVSLKEGLVVPVIRNADGLTLAELNARSKELAEKARNGKLGPDEMTGGTFTISNMGMLDVENFTAIINPGESAILAVSSTLNKPVALGDQVVVRSIMKMTLSSDHRLIDGAMAVRFINAVKQKLEDIEQWKLLTS
jgi:pyruvate dehydrogenase E2 component (dihydrolipoamide acetyltransferase)